MQSMPMPELEVYRGATDPAELYAIYRQMLFIRRFEERVLQLFAEGKLNGTTHTYIGEEAVAVGVFANLSPADIVFSNHRCHGHYLMHQDDPEGLLAELMGREGGVCAGRGGSQHIHRGNFYTNGVQGGIVPNAAGMAWALKLDREAGVTSEATPSSLTCATEPAGAAPIAVVFMGDGTLGEGQVYETFNMASLWHLPILFVIENNYWAQSTPSYKSLAGTIAARPQAFAINTREVSSQDALVVRREAAQAIAQVRAGQGPQTLVCNTYRFCHHSKADDGRPQECVLPWLQHDPLDIVAQRLTAEQCRDAALWVEQRLAAAEAGAEAQPPATVAFSAPIPVPPLATVGSATSTSVSATAGSATSTSVPSTSVSATVPLELPPVQAGERVAARLRSALRAKVVADSRVVVLGEDISDPYGGSFKVTRGLSTDFPSRVVSTPISEASMTGLAAGLALRGKRPVLEIMFGDFITLCLDQLINYVAKYRGMYNDSATCPLVLRTPMGGRRGYGPTHSQTLDRLVLGTPDLRVVAPSLWHDPGALLVAAIDDPAPVVFLENKLLYARPLQHLTSDGRSGFWQVRASRETYPTLQFSLTDFASSQVTLLAYGGMLALALEAAEQLLIEHEIACEVVAPSLLSAGLVPEMVESLARSSGHLAVAEEGSGFAAWGSEIISQAAEQGLLRGRAVRIAAPLVPIPTALSLERQVLPGVDDIVRALSTCRFS